jgi:hypothetical protein
MIATILKNADTFEFKNCDLPKYHTESTRDIGVRCKLW